MQLMHVSIENFGRLHHLEMDFTENFQVMNRHNGWGKSTFAAFLVVMFYGFANEKKRNDIENERKRYAPWQDGVYGGSILFRESGHVWRIERRFGRKDAKTDEFRLYDAVTNLPSEAYGPNIGEQLFQIDRESFLYTAVWRRDALETRITPSINAKIGDLQHDLTDMTEYESAQSKLKKELDHATPDRKTGELYRLSRDISEKEAALERESSVKQSYCDLKEQLDINKEQLHRLTGRKEQLQQQLLEIDERLNDSEKSSLRQREAQRGKGSVGIRIVSAVFVLVGVLLLLISIISTGNMSVTVFGNTADTSAGTISGITFVRIAACCLLAIGAIGILLGRHTGRNHSQQVRNTVSLQEENQLLQKIVQKLAVLDTDYATALRDKETIHSSLQQLEKQLQAIDYIREELLALKEKEERLSHRYEILKKTKDYLEQAKLRFSLKYLDRMKEAFDRYYRDFSVNRKSNIQIPNRDNRGYDELVDEQSLQFTIDADFQVSLRSHGASRDIRLLSSGQQALVALARRMAMLDAMYTEEKPFLVLDDSLGDLDDENLSMTMRALKNISTKYQIIYFTCHESRL